MRIAITSTGPTLNDQVEVRFGRCPYFIIVDPETMEFEAIENPNIAVGGGAGVQSAQLMADRGVQTVLTGNCGPNAFHVFGAAGIQVIVGVTGRVRDAIAQYSQGAFASAPGPSVASHFGIGGGPGMGGGTGGGRGTGRGMGGGRGMGRGMGAGRGVGLARGFPAPPPPMPTGEERADELSALKQQAEALSQHMQEIQQRIRDLEKEEGGA